MVISVLIVDDQPATRSGLRMLLSLEPDLAVIGEAADATEAMEKAVAATPDVVVMDVAMPGLDGINATALLRARLPRSAVVILTLYDDPPIRARARAAGAAAVVGKHEGDGPLLAAIRLAAGARPN